jgi:predicted TIM-barrel enzyme
MKPFPAKSNTPPLWVVAYVNQPGGHSPARLTEGACQDIEASLAGGADAVVLINEFCGLAELERTISDVRQKYPRAPLGVNYLGDDSEPYGYRESFRLARDYGLEVVWTDFSGVDRIAEKPPVDLQAIEEARAKAHADGARFFYCSGIHMKYSTLLDPTKTIERSAQQAMGWVDGVVVTGPKTGVPVSPDTARRARAALGTHPLGVASGVTPENVASIRECMDFYLVASSLQELEADGRKAISREKVARLRAAIDGR